MWWFTIVNCRISMDGTGRYTSFGETHLNWTSETTWLIFCLVVYLPLWKIWKSVGMMKFPIYGKIKAMFQSTNHVFIACHTWFDPGKTTAAPSIPTAEIVSKLCIWTNHGEIRNHQTTPSTQPGIDWIWRWPFPSKIGPRTTRTWVQGMNNVRHSDWTEQSCMGIYALFRIPGKKKSKQKS